MPSDSEPRTKAERDSVIGAMPWYDESDPDYSELDAALAAIRAEAARRALEDVAERVRGLPTFDDGAMSRSTDVVLPCVDRAAVLAMLSTKEEGS